MPDTDPLAPIVRAADAMARGGPPLDLISLDVLEVAARERLAPAIFDFIAGGAGAELTLRANRAAFDAVRLVPQILVPVTAPDTSTTLFGDRLSMPVFVSPMSAHGLVHVDAEVASARGTARAGTAFCAPTLSNCTLEEIAAAMPTGPRWFQLYPRRDAGATRELLQRAEAAGYSAIVLTVDQATNGLRERDRRHHFTFPTRLRFPNVERHGTTDLATVEGAVSDAQHDITWDDYERWRRETRLPVIVKGVLSPAVAAEAAWREVPAIVVSNHGGRQLDGGLAALDALPDIVDRVQGRTLLLLDGGVRRGVDVVKALALGAHAVGIGRPVLWALALEGDDGVRAALEVLRLELVNAMTLIGVSRLAELTTDHVR